MGLVYIFQDLITLDLVSINLLFGRNCCPMSIHVTPGAPTLYWQEMLSNIDSCYAEGLLPPCHNSGSAI